MDGLSGRLGDSTCLKRDSSESRRTRAEELGGGFSGGFVGAGLARGVGDVGVSGEFGEFSNFAPFPVQIDGKKWPTSEHYFQAQKFVGDEHVEAIRKAMNHEPSIDWLLENQESVVHSYYKRGLAGEL